MERVRFGKRGFQGSFILLDVEYVFSEWTMENAEEVDLTELEGNSNHKNTVGKSDHAEDFEHD